MVVVVAGNSKAKKPPSPPPPPPTQQKTHQKTRQSCASREYVQEYWHFFYATCEKVSSLFSAL